MSFLPFLHSFYLNYLHLCPESLPDVHLIRACSVNLACGAAVLCLHHAGKKSTTMPFNQQDAQKKHSALLLIVTGFFSKSPVCCELHNKMLCLVYQIVIHNTHNITWILHRFSVSINATTVTVCTQCRYVVTVLDQSISE